MIPLLTAFVRCHPVRMDLMPPCSAFLLGWWTFGSSAGSGTLAILGSELGDKTFFIAAILSMTHPQLSVWSGAVSALSIMTVGASALGSAVPLFLPLKVTHILAIALFAGFGVKMLWDSRSANDGVSGKLGQVEKDAKEKSDASANADVWRTASQIVLQAFALTFFSEWGDRSQMVTLAIAADADVYGVSFGCTLGHCLCTGIAVVGGRYAATRLSEKIVLIAGGSLFLVFAALMGFGGLSTHTEWGEALFSF